MTEELKKLHISWELFKLWRQCVCVVLFEVSMFWVFLATSSTPNCSWGASRGVPSRWYHAWSFRRCWSSLDLGRLNDQKGAILDGFLPFQIYIRGRPNKRMWWWIFWLGLFSPDSTVGKTSVRLHACYPRIGQKYQGYQHCFASDWPYRGRWVCLVRNGWWADTPLGGDGPVKLQVTTSFFADETNGSCVCTIFIYNWFTLIQQISNPTNCLKIGTYIIPSKLRTGVGNT